MSINLKNKTIFEKIINILLDILIVIFGIILFISMYNWFQIKLLKNDYSSFFGYSTFEVETGSMADTINPGDWIIVKYKSNYKLNDIVTYKQNGEYITHRIVEAYNDSYITKGDANTPKDKPISKDQVIGKTVKILPYFGILRKTLFNPIVLVAAIVTLYLIGTLFKDNKKNNKTKIKNIFNSRKNVKSEVPIAVKIENETSKIDNLIEEENIINSEEKERIISNIEPMDEESLNKTMCFRMIEVDLDDVESSKIPVLIEDEQIIEKTKEKIKSNKVPKISSKQKDIVKKIDEIIQNKKFKNFIEKIMFIKSEEINEFFDIFIIPSDNKYILNIKKLFIDQYIESKYYNDFSDSKRVIKDSKLINNIYNKVIEKSTSFNDKYLDSVIVYKNILDIILKIENLKIDKAFTKKEVITLYLELIDNYAKNNNWDNDKIKYVADQLFRTKTEYSTLVESLFKKMDTKMFNLIFNKINSKKDLYALELKHNINFSKVYSEYIVDKVYTEGIVAEDKTIVLLTLLQLQLLKNMFLSDFSKKYILYIPDSLYTKEAKLNKVLKMFDDEYAKNSIIILVNYNELLNNKQLIKTLRTTGYRFSIFFNGNVNIKTKDIGIIGVVDYIFIDKKSIDSSKIISFIPEDFTSNIIYENIIDKIGNDGGE